MLISLWSLPINVLLKVLAGSALPRRLVRRYSPLKGLHYLLHYTALLHFNASEWSTSSLSRGGGDGAEGRGEGTAEVEHKVDASTVWGNYS